MAGRVGESVGRVRDMQVDKIGWLDGTLGRVGEWTGGWMDG